jgi:hypothetical protein
MTMTLLFDDAAAETTPDAGKTSLLGRGIGAVAAVFAGWHAARARRIALVSLMEMDAHRLNDLGIDVSDVVDALNRR